MSIASDFRESVRARLRVISNPLWHRVRSGNWNVEPAGLYEEQTDLQMTDLFLSGRLRWPSPRTREQSQLRASVDALAQYRYLVGCPDSGSGSGLAVFRRRRPLPHSASRTNVTCGVPQPEGCSLRGCMSLPASKATSKLVALTSGRRYHLSTQAISSNGLAWSIWTRDGATASPSTSA